MSLILQVFIDSVEISVEVNLSNFAYQFVIWAQFVAQLEHPVKELDGSNTVIKIY